MPDIGFSDTLVRFPINGSARLSTTTKQVLRVGGTSGAVLLLVMQVREGASE